MAEEDLQRLGRSYGCRWAQCRESFLINADLIRHVVHLHVRAAVPVKRKLVVPFHKPEGQSRTPSSPASFETHDSLCKVPPDREEPSSSLPSPPCSCKPSLSPVVPLPKDDSFNELMNSDSTGSLLSDRPLDAIPDSGSLVEWSPPPPDAPSTPARARSHEGPTFESLSSPDDPISVIAIPPSPSFDALVQNAVSGKSVTVQTEQNTHRLDLQSSQSSSTSIDVVEQQLTQAMDVDEPHRDIPGLGGDASVPSAFDQAPNTRPSHIEAPASCELIQKGENHTTVLSLVKIQTSARTSPPRHNAGSTSPVQHSEALLHRLALHPSIRAQSHQPTRQSWYSVLPHRRRQSRKASTTPATPVTRRPRYSAPSNQQADKLEKGSMEINAFHSGTLQVLPISSIPGDPALDKDGLFALQGQSQESSYGPYPSLQTQAPYESQSSLSQ